MESRYDIAVLTDQRYVRPAELNEYVNNVLLEDRLVVEALEAKGLRVIRLAWDDASFDWSSTRAILFRTTWDYDHRIAEFRAWMNELPESVQLINAREIVEWNLSKDYLLELSSKGVNIPPTRLFRKGSAVSLPQIMDEEGWTEAVIKPVVAAGGRETYRVKTDNMEVESKRFSELVLSEDMMIQEFRKNVASQGEWSFMVFGNEVSHAVLKVAKSGDFRVQDDYGGSVHDHVLSQEDIAFAKKAVSAVSPRPLYARVDAFRDNDGQLALGELEMIEPELWFRNHPPSAKLFAGQICTRYFPDRVSTTE